MHGMIPKEQVDWQSGHKSLLIEPFQNFIPLTEGFVYSSWQALLLRKLSCHCRVGEPGSCSEVPSLCMDLPVFRWFTQIPGNLLLAFTRLNYLQIPNGQNLSQLHTVLKTLLWKVHKGQLAFSRIMLRFI